MRKVFVGIHWRWTKNWNLEGRLIWNGMWEKRILVLNSLGLCWFWCNVSYRLMGIVLWARQIVDIDFLIRIWLLDLFYPTVISYSLRYSVYFKFRQRLKDSTKGSCYLPLITQNIFQSSTKIHCFSFNSPSKPHPQFHLFIPTLDVIAIN